MAAKKQNASKVPEKKQTSSNVETQNPKEPMPSIEVRIDRLIEREHSNVKAIASANIGDAFAMHGIKIIDSYKGLFVAMPSEPYTDQDGKTQYRDICHPINGAARNELVHKVQEAYQEILDEQQAETESETETETEQLAQGM